MDESKLEALIENEKEWRRYMATRMESVEQRLADSIAWQLVFRVLGGTMFALLIAWIEMKGL